MTRTFSGTYPKPVKSSSNPGHNVWLACTSPLASSITCEVSSVGSSPDVITVCSKMGHCKLQAPSEKAQF